MTAGSDRPVPDVGSADPRPWRSDSGAARSEEAATRRAVAEGRVTLAPRMDGWVVVTARDDGELEETPVLDRDGRRIQSWDQARLSRWMHDRDQHTLAARRRPGLLARLLQPFRR